MVSAIGFLRLWGWRDRLGLQPKRCWSLVVVWTSSYLFRVVTGRMTYMQQRRRYRSEYDQLTAQQLQERLMPESRRTGGSDGFDL